MKKSEDVLKEYQALEQKRNELSAEMLRLEGAFRVLKEEEDKNNKKDESKGKKS